MSTQTKSLPTYEALNQLLAEHFYGYGERIQNMPLDASLFEDEYGFEARDMLLLVLLIERKWGIRIGAEQIQKGFYTKRDIIRAIDELL